MVAAAVVAASAVIVVLIIVVMSKVRSRRLSRTQVETERQEVTSFERRTWLENQRQQPKPRMAGENLIPSLDEQPEEQPDELRPSAPVSPGTKPGVASPYPAEEPVGAGVAKEVKVPAAGEPVGAGIAKKAEVPAAGEPEGSGLAKKVEIPAIDDEAEFAEETVKRGADAGLSAFMIEMSEDDGLSKLAENLEDLDVGDLAEIARDILSKRAK
jgi:hypothetical protein